MNGSTWSYMGSPPRTADVGSQGKKHMFRPSGPKKTRRLRDLVAGSAFEVDGFAGDEAGAEEPHDGVDDVVGFAVAADVGSGGALAQERGFALAEAVPGAGVDDAGGDRVDAHRGEVGREVAGGVLDRAVGDSLDE